MKTIHDTSTKQCIHKNIKFKNERLSVNSMHLLKNVRDGTFGGKYINV